MCLPKAPVTSLFFYAELERSYRNVELVLSAVYISTLPLFIAKLLKFVFWIRRFGVASIITSKQQPWYRKSSSIRTIPAIWQETTTKFLLEQYRQLKNVDHTVQDVLKTSPTVVDSLSLWQTKWVSDHWWSFIMQSPFQQFFKSDWKENTLN